MEHEAKLGCILRYKGDSCFTSVYTVELEVKAIMLSQVSDVKHARERKGRCPSEFAE